MGTGLVARRARRLRPRCSYDAPASVQPEPTGENVQFSRVLLAEQGVDVSSVLLVSKPYEERRAYATARKFWPEVEIISASTPMSFGEYVESIGDARLVVDMLVGAQQRLLVYPQEGFMISMDVPADVTAAYERLCAAGFTSRLIREAVDRSTG
ncbi:YdcF family protein [Streptomyces sp. NPDC052302]|uniref:YdcF family protein n=1 Tax=Streptomyces sp. NPDC052302 TaxID=3365688 RepID=UPI0037CD71A6